MTELVERLWVFWYWFGRIPAILLDLPIDWPQIPKGIDPLNPSRRATHPSQEAG